MSEAAEEPTMEDILASIRKIISDDGASKSGDGQTKPDAAPQQLAVDPAEAAAKPIQQPPAEPQMSPQMAQQPAQRAPIQPTIIQPQRQATPQPRQPQPQPQPIATRGGQNPNSDNNDVLVLDQPIKIGKQPSSARGGNATPAQAGEDRLLSAATEALGTAAFASLERAVRMGRAGETLEDLVRNILRPMLRSWIDQNLPPLVEKMVQSEIQKIVSGARRNWDDEF